MRRAALLTLVAGVAACSDSASPRMPTEPPAPPVYQVTVRDAAGDAILRPGTGAPDLLSCTVRAQPNGDIEVSIGFVPGTYDPARALIQIPVDADQDIGTGDVRDGLGADYMMSFVETPRPAVSLRIWQDASWRFVVALPSFTIGPDNLSFRLALSDLGNDEGRLNFRVEVYGQDDDGRFFRPVDFLPDRPLPPAITR